MSKIYVTEQGDTFDMIAFKQMGSCKYVGVLMEANRNLIDHFIFSDGEKIIIPDVEDLNVVENRPPWRR